ncbi:DEAD/DEAH box helicase [Sphingomonas sp.]|uniref:DEAD/DEAH box helicase n=1 Tax=Sphingomonas sp. TaxID=28214 RepID=UPI003D6CCE07
MTARLTIVSKGANRLAVSRDAEVSNVLWGKILAEWGTAGKPDSSIVVPVEAFLSNLDWLAGYCRRFETSIDWDDATLALVGQSRRERNSLGEVMRNLSPLDEQAVLARLESGRFTRDLRPFQIRDLGKLLALPNGANFSIPGAGKTTVTYALYEAERLAGRVDRLLVVAPLSAFDAWMGEAEACFEVSPNVHRLDARVIPATVEVCLVNYQRLTSAYPRLARWAQAGKCHVVLDEAHRMKRGWSGQWGRASLQLAYLAARRDVLTGTPAPQSLRDLDAILDFAWPTQARRILPPAVFNRAQPPNLATQTGAAIRPLFVRTTKADLALPKPIFRVVEVALEGLQGDIYHALRNQYAGQLSVSRGERTALARMGQITMYLLEAATNPGLLPFGKRPDPVTARPRFPLSTIPRDSNLAALIADYPEYENPPKFVVLSQLVRDNAALGRKTLVWTNFVTNIELLEEAFRALRPAIIHGGIPSEITAPNAPRTREAELHRFRHDPSCAVLIANPAATSEGVSLHHHCHDAVYLDRTFNAGHYLQSIDRIHRLGMDPGVETRITFLVTTGTVDVTVDNRVDVKARRLGAILSDDAIATMALPDDDDYEEVIAPDDLAALFAHLRGDDAGQGPVQRS